MENNENKKVSILVEETARKKNDGFLQDNSKSKAEKLKKPIIFALMGIVFIGCMYLVFKPSSNNKKTEDIGLNDAVPQATDAGMQPDKQKAYEQASLEQKAQGEKNTLMSLSDYWNSDSLEENSFSQPEKNDMNNRGYRKKNGDAALNSYRKAQGVLGSFYQDNSNETTELRRKIDDLKQQLNDRSTTPTPFTMNDQLQLMEKSYQMATKYLPSNNKANSGNNVQSKGDSVVGTQTQKSSFVAFTPVRKNIVSALYREPSDHEFLEKVNSERNRGFYTAGTTEQATSPRNSIRACVQETQTISGESGVKIRLLEAAGIPGYTIPAGTVLTAGAKFNNGRLQLKVSSIELDGNIIPVDIMVYDLDGQQGLYVPYSPEMNALTEIASNMSQTSGTSIMMTRSAGQQAAGDLSRGVVQGISGYFSKKIRTPKITLKAGHQLFLVSKK